MMEEQSGFLAWLKSIWPRIYRITNSIFYNLINFLKKSVRLIIDQLRYG